MKYYVYMLLRDGDIPFYVGMGHGNRWLSHECEAKKTVHRKSTNHHKLNIIRDMWAQGMELKKVKIYEGLSVEDARRLEIETIASIGRRPAGPLVNMTRGGDGLVDPSSEVRARIAAKVAELMKGNQHLRGHKHTEESKRKISESLRANTVFCKQRSDWVNLMQADPAMSAKTRAASSARHRGVPKSPEHRAKIAAALRGNKNGLGYKHTPENREKLARQHAERNRTPEHRAAVSRALKGRKFSEESLEKMRQGQKARRQREKEQSNAESCQ